VAGRIRSIEKFNDLNGNRTCHLLAGSIVPQPTMLPCGPEVVSYVKNIFWDMTPCSPLSCN
jgi:hypothetical protein